MIKLTQDSIVVTQDYSVWLVTDANTMTNIKFPESRVCTLDYNEDYVHEWIDDLNIKSIDGHIL